MNVVIPQCKKPSAALCADCMNGLKNKVPLVRDQVLPGPVQRTRRLNAVHNYLVVVVLLLWLVFYFACLDNCPVPHCFFFFVHMYLNNYIIFTIFSLNSTTLYLKLNI